MKTVTKTRNNKAVAKQNALQTSIEKTCSTPRANITAWTWASDKICRTCYYYDGQYCIKDGKRYGENNYCSYWRP